jgi:capsular polysaccharide biosynthesis protein
MLKYDNEEIDLCDLINLFRRKLVIVLIITILCSACGYFISKFFLVPEYQAGATMIVNNRQVADPNLTSGDLSASASLVNTYAVIIRSYTVLEQVIEDLDLDVSYESLSKAIKVSSVDGTQIMEVSMRHTDPKYAVAIIDKITEVAPDILVDKIKAGSCEVISRARYSPDPVSPNTARNTVIFGFIGFCACFAVIFLRAVLNNTFTTKEDIENVLEIPVLSVIPFVHEHERKDQKQYEKKRN